MSPWLLVEVAYETVVHLVTVTPRILFPTRAGLYASDCRCQETKYLSRPTFFLPSCSQQAQRIDRPMDFYAETVASADNTTSFSSLVSARNTAELVECKLSPGGQVPNLGPGPSRLVHPITGIRRPAASVHSAGEITSPSIERIGE